MTSDFSEAGEQAEGFLAMCEFSRLEDKAVKAAAAAGRAGRARDRFAAFPAGQEQ